MDFETIKVVIVAFTGGYQGQGMFHVNSSSCKWMASR